jgi:TolA-binding protein
MRRSFRLLCVPAVVLAAGACFATRNDVRTLQGDIAVLRAENARSDSVHRAQFAAAATQAGAVADSLRSLNAVLARFVSDVSRFQGDLSITMHTFGQQLITLQELAGQTQKRQQDLKAELERQTSELATAAQPSAAVPGAAQQGGPPTGPNQLLNTCNSMINRASYSAARAACEGFLEQFPTHEMAGEAMYGVARSFDLDGNAGAADSVYAIVVEKYPKTEHAPTALYKRAMAAQQAGQAAKAKQFFQQLMDNYSRSPEALRAADILNKKP